MEILDKNVRVLVVDDEKIIRDSLIQFMQKRGYDVDQAETTKQGMELIRKKGFDMVLLDIRMPDISGLRMLKEIQETHPDLAVVMMSGHGNMDTVIEALRLGAADFLRKPIRVKELKAALEKTLRFRRMKETEARLRETLHTFQRDVSSNSLEELMMGESQSIQDLRNRIRIIADSGTGTVLITGETGTGKEVAAKALHMQSRPPNAPFISVNCPALPDSLVESELFGHVKGSFTGAIDNRMGAFELAHGGTLFLDEIADLAPLAQAKLLRVLENRMIRRIGGNTEREIETTVVAATNQRLDKLVADGLFRKDLLFRLNIVELDLPPLRERPEDILPLARHFYRLRCLKAHRDESPSPNFSEEFSSDIRRTLLSYDYPGNIRELKNIIERATILSKGAPLSAKHIFFPARQIDSPENLSVEREHASYPANTSGQAKLVREALEKTKWNRREAAKFLGISYDALRWRIRKYKIV